MKRITVLFFSVLSLLRLVAAEPPILRNTVQNNKSMIREDRIWEYYNDQNNTGWSARKLKLMRAKFDGTTEINGQTYHDFVSIYRRVFESHHPEYIPDYDLISDKREVIAHIREENGRYYMILPKDATDESELFWFIENYYGSPEYETLIYDFNREKGETYNRISHLPEEVIEGILTDENDVSVFDFKVLESELLSSRELGFLNGNDGELLRRMTIKNHWVEDDVVESIGAITNSLPFPIADRFFYMPTDGGIRPMGCWLNRVYDLEGNIVFALGNSDPLFPDTSNIDSPDSAKSGLSVRDGLIEVNCPYTSGADIFVYSSDASLLHKESVASGSSVIKFDVKGLGNVIIKLVSEEEVKVIKHIGK